MAYARLALESLYRNCAEEISLTLITDTQGDVIALTNELKNLKNQGNYGKRTEVVYGEADLADLEHAKFRNFAHPAVF